MKFVHLDHKEWGRIDYACRDLTGRPDDESVLMLLVNTAKAYADSNISYREKIGICEFPFQWGERQNLGPMYRALDAATGYMPILPELPFELDEGKEKYIDFWVLIKKAKLDVLIEYKHGNINLKDIVSRDDPTPFFYWKWLTWNWENDSNKLEEISMHHIKKNFMTREKEKIRRPKKVIFLAAPVIQKSKANTSLLCKSDFLKGLKKFKRLLKPSPNLEASWWFPERFQETENEAQKNDEGETNGYVHYKGLYFYARIFD